MEVQYKLALGDLLQEAMAVWTNNAVTTRDPRHHEHDLTFCTTTAWTGLDFGITGHGIGCKYGYRKEWCHPTGVSETCE